MKELLLKGGIFSCLLNIHWLCHLLQQIEFDGIGDVSVPSQESISSVHFWSIIGKVFHYRGNKLSFVYLNWFENRSGRYKLSYLRTINHLLLAKLLQHYIWSQFFLFLYYYDYKLLISTLLFDTSIIIISIH